MTSERVMLVSGRGSSSGAGRRPRAWGVLVLGLLAGLVSGGCSSSDRLVAPEVVVSPYDVSGGEVLLAVAPPRNESGSSDVRVLEVGDALVAALEEVRGVRCVSMNRTLAAMRSLGLSSVETPTDAERLASALGADGLVLGSVTAWDPYNPPVIGLAVVLHARGGQLVRRSASGDVDVRSVRVQPTDYRYFPGSAYASAPSSAASEHFDGRNHGVLMEVRGFAEGRHDSGRALNWKVYLASMDLFTEFAAHAMARRLMEAEWLRLAREGGEWMTDGSSAGSAGTP